MCVCSISLVFFFFEQKTAYEMRISDWSSDVCSSDLLVEDEHRRHCPRATGMEAAGGHWRTQIETARLVDRWPTAPRGHDEPRQNGRASCRERASPSV